MSIHPAPPSPPPTSASSHGASNRSSRTWRRVWILVVFVVAGGGYAALRSGGNAKVDGPGQGSTAVAGGGQPGNTNRGIPPIPVILGTVQENDVPLYADGLGTVQAFNTSTVRARVDGLLTKIEFQEGTEVKAGDILAQIDPEPFRVAVAQAEARRAQDQAQLQNAKVDLSRNQDLVTNSIVSRQVLDTAQSLVDQLQATVLADQAAIDSAMIQLGYTSVRAPISGRTGLRLVDIGNMIHTGDSNGLVVITQMKPCAVVFTLPQPILSEIQQRMAEGELSVLALDRDNKSLLSTGKLSVVDNQIDVTTGTIRLKAVFDNEDLRLWPGQFVNVRLRLSIRSNSVVVPASVIQRGPDGSFVFSVDDDNKVAVRKVKLLQIDDGQAIIESGLKRGERVVTDGQYRLQAGSHVRALDNAGSGVSRGNGRKPEAANGGTKTNRTSSP